MPESTRTGASRPSRREFIYGGALFGLSAAGASAGCATQNGESATQAAAPLERPLFNGVSPKSGDVYPFTYRDLEVNGRRIHYVDEGSGPVVMLVHGQGNWSYHYRGVIDRLKGRARVICHDHFGNGLSEQATFHRQYTIENHISTFFGVVESLNLRDITIYCMDWGGPISLAYATTHPENIRGLVIGNTWAWSEHVPFLRGIEWRTRLSPVVRTLAARMAVGAGGGQTQDVGGDWNSPEALEVAGYPNRYSKLADTRGMAFNRSTQNSPDHPLEYLRRTARTFRQTEAGLAKLQHLPVRIMAPGDRIFTPAEQERWRKIFPKAPPLIPIPVQQHVAQASEVGSDIIAAAIGDVLDEAAGQQGGA